MERLDGILTKRKEDIIRFSPEETDAYGVPALLSVEEALVTAYGIRRVTTGLYKRGFSKVEQTEVDEALDLLGLMNSNLAHMEGEMLKERSDDMVKFSSNIVALLTREELLALQGPAHEYLDAQMSLD